MSSKRKVSEFSDELYQPDMERVLAAVKRLRVLSEVQSNSHHEYAQEIVEENLLPKLVEFLFLDDNESLQLESGWLLTNICSGCTQDVEAVVAAGAVSGLICLLNSRNRDLLQQSVWCLGNIACDNTHHREFLLGHCIFPRLVAIAEMFMNARDTQRLHTVCWAICCFMRTGTDVNVLIHCAIQVITRMAHWDDDEIVLRGAWVLSDMSYDQNSFQDIVEAGAIPRMIELLNHRNFSIVCSALRVVGNVASRAVQQKQLVFDFNVVPILVNMYAADQAELCGNILITLSNLCAGTTRQVQACIDCGVVKLALECCRSETLEIRANACWLLSNITDNGDIGQIEHLVGRRMIPACCFALGRTKDVRALSKILRGLENIVKFSLASNPSIYERAQDQLRIWEVRKHINC